MNNQGHEVIVLDKVQEIQRALEVSTPGPWTCDPFINGYGVKAGNYYNQIALITENSGINRDREQAKNNAHLIANAPEWISFLLTELETVREYWMQERELFAGQKEHLRQENDRLTKALDRVGFYCAGTELNNVSEFVLRVKSGEQV